MNSLTTSTGFQSRTARPDHRVVVVGGTLAAASVVIGQLVADDSSVLLGIELVLDWSDERLD